MSVNKSGNGGIGWGGPWGKAGLRRVDQREELCFEVLFEQCQRGGRTDVKW